MHNRKISLWFVLPLFAVSLYGADLPSIQEKTKGMKQFKGFMDSYWNDATGEMFMKIDKFDSELLYIRSLSAGIGSNDIGLDRAQLGGSHLVLFERVGPKVLMVEQNYGYRAVSEDEAERKAVEDAFARSTHWGFKVEAETGKAVLVNATKFFLRDAHNVTGRLKQSRQGSYKIDESRSAFYLPRTENFPNNSEFEVTLTFVGTPEGRYIRDVSPTASAVTVRQHHAFVELPEAGYETRKFDPRAGMNGLTYMDYATSLDERIVKKVISRHRLNRKNTSGRRGEPVEPIVYYIDPGMPEPVRSAAFDGARWWNQAFDAAGYKDGFVVKLLPKDVSPMDIRYNVVNWVHRATRGWSYGGSVRDPRTGEILKGHVVLGSLRLRQDYLIAEGLMAPYENGTKVPDDMRELALARLRQLVAHEIGHTLGLPHNYISSAQGRASVMDYPHPMMKIRSNGTLDWSHAYDTDIGEWDKVAVEYAYRDFSKGTNENSELEKVLSNAWNRGLWFITDQDARPLGSAHPQAHLWDNGENAVDQLNHLMKVRGIALSNFGEANIREGAPYSSLEEVLVPLYLHHRYQLEAASKVVGGLEFRYAVRGDGQPVVKIIDPKEQRRALDALMNTVTPKALAIPADVLDLIPPRAFGYPRTRETFNVHTGVAFDALAAAETAAGLTMQMVLHHERAARLVEYHARDSKNPDLDEVINTVFKNTWYASRKSGLDGEIQKVVDMVTLHYLMGLASHGSASHQAKAVAMMKIGELNEWLNSQEKRERNEGLKAHYGYATHLIQQFTDDPSSVTVPEPVDPPAGSPIGMGGDDWCGWSGN
ncbi:MAG TPA: zinc-dependent metalloprotease [Candidatus Marinimicrobia bacterium]|nr:zinc-dependent metalloprotease [Candidatus Neomarinimicrobiota bacterium]